MLEEDWNEEEGEAEGYKEEEVDFENDDLLDETFVPESTTALTPMEEDGFGT